MAFCGFREEFVRSGNGRKKDLCGLGTTKVWGNFRERLLLGLIDLADSHGGEGGFEGFLESLQERYLGNLVDLREKL